MRQVLNHLKACHFDEVYSDWAKQFWSAKAFKVDGVGLTLKTCGHERFTPAYLRRDPQ